MSIENDSDLEYILSELDYESRKTFDIVAGRILDKINARDEYNIELQVHNIIIKNVHYVKNGSDYVHTIEGPILNKKSVCDGISKAVKYLLNSKSIDCEVVYGYLRDNKTVGHAWNIVKIDGAWYHLDVTADLNLSIKNYRYDYFNLSDVEISRDHIVTDSKHSCEVSKNSYYYRNNLVMNTQNQFIHYLSNSIRSGMRTVVIMLPSARNPKEVYNTIFERTEDAIQATGVSVSSIDMKYNPDQLVFEIELL